MYIYIVYISQASYFAFFAQKSNFEVGLSIWTAPYCPGTTTAGRWTVPAVQTTTPFCAGYATISSAQWSSRPLKTEQGKHWKHLSLVSSFFREDTTWKISFFSGRITKDRVTPPHLLDLSGFFQRSIKKKAKSSRKKDKKEKHFSKFYSQWNSEAAPHFWPSLVCVSPTPLWPTVPGTSSATLFSIRFWAVRVILTFKPSF